ncbi:MAG: hypothetical protein QGI45_13975 [Myxococcota bacterium]|jgi:hypothetical protein|nr:hypothetical protein [Myxococcota bacterium]
MRIKGLLLLAFILVPILSGCGLDPQNGHSHDMVDEAGTTQLTNRYHTHICPGTLSNHKFTPEIQYNEGCWRSNSNQSSRQTSMKA